MATESTSARRQPKKTKQTSHLLREVLPNLPPEIIIDILPRLPVKSLLRFRCVSKSWRSLISQPEFAKTHLSLASRNNDYGHHRVVLSDQDGYTGVNCSIYSISNEQSDNTALKLDCLVKGPYCGERIVGCCNGLVCIVTEREVRIWNPSTRKSKRFANVGKQYHYLGRNVMYGFGYDESIDDYKVVRFFRDLNSSLEVEVQMCTLRTHSWRRIGIGSFPLCLPSDGSVANLNGIFVSGALHWFLGGSRSRIIVSLDLAKETHGEVMEPHYQRGTSSYKIRFLLDALNGCLCILATYYDCTDVWVMKEYGIRESWAKLVTITYAGHPFDGYPYSQPLCILANGEILLDIQWQLALYNCKDGTFSYPMIHIFSSFSVHTYVESLVSPDTDTDTDAGSGV